MTNWKKSLASVQQKLEKLSVAGFLVGSRVYSKQFNKESDIDLILVINDMPDWRKICRTLYFNSSFVDESIKLVKEEKAEYFCLKFSYLGISYSVDFLLETFFEKALSDILKRKTRIYHKVTNHPQINAYKFGSGKKRLSVPKKNSSYNYCFTVSSPLCIVKNKVFYLGILLDKLVTGYTTLWDYNHFEESAKKFITAGAKNITISKDYIEPKTVISSVNRFEKLPVTHINKSISLLAGLLAKSPIQTSGSRMFYK